MRTHILAAVLGVGVFALVALASGRVDVRGGLGWDGSAYAQMVTGSLSDGTPNMMTRPLIVLVARIPYALGLDVISAFQLVNYLSAFVLYLAVGLLLQREGVSAHVRMVIVANLAACIATAKMFAFYPVLIDLGALAVITVAFYCAGTGTRWAAGATAVLAAASREFGIAVALYGVVRSIRMRRPWSETLAVYTPAFLTTVAIRLTIGRGGDAGGPFSLADGLGNLSFWMSPAFVGFFAYFSVVVLGGVTTLLAVRPGACLKALRAEPELGIFAAAVVAATMMGSLDIWRYLVFILPVAIVLVGRELRGLDAAAVSAVLVVMTLITVLTQRPFEQMTTATYFRDWFPLYEVMDRAVPSGTLFEVWRSRMTSLALVLVASWMFLRHVRQQVPAGAVPSRTAV